ncbi:hypothetical protein, partial [Acinetobacter baumannii]
MLILADEAPVTLPYGFARRNGVLLRVTDTGVECVHKTGAALDGLLEVQRLA